LVTQNSFEQKWVMDMAVVTQNSLERKWVMEQISGFEFR